MFFKVTSVKRKGSVVPSEGVNYSKLGDINYWNEILPGDEAIVFIEQDIKIQDIVYLKEEELEKIIEHFDLKEKLKVRKIREDLISQKNNNVSKPRRKSVLPTVTLRTSNDNEENNHNNNNNKVVTTCILS